jgi:hypothetical protein
MADHFSPDLDQLFTERSQRPPLHELVHLEKFFIQQYGIIVHEKENLSKIDIVFKNLPEDYVAHKVINYEYDFEPIDRAWFKDKDNLQIPSEEIAANLVNFWAFSKFCPEYKDKLKSFSAKCRRQKPLASQKAHRVIQALKKMDYRRRDSYNHCADEIIKIFAPNYYGKQNIHLAYVSKIEDRWYFNSLSV